MAYSAETFVMSAKALCLVRVPSALTALAHVEGNLLLFVRLWILLETLLRKKKITDIERLGLETCSWSHFSVTFATSGTLQNKALFRIDLRIAKFWSTFGGPRWIRSGHARHQLCRTT